MRRAALSVRLGWSDLRRRRAETLLLLLAATVAATTLTIGLVLHGQTATPYAQTRAATAGPDVVGFLSPRPRHALGAPDVDRLEAYSRAPDVVAHSGPFPETWTSVQTGRFTTVAAVQGRDRAPSAVDRPHLVGRGSWVRPGGAVVEQAFAQALQVQVGDSITLGGRKVAVVGIAVSAALPSYPRLCTLGCILDEPGWGVQQPGLVWLTRSDATAYASRREPLVWFSYLRLAHPADARHFAAEHGSQSPFRPEFTPWQDVARRHAETLQNERAVVLFGSSLLIVLAVATVVVLVGGRMADEVRRVGTLKALGATPGFVVRSLLVSYLAVCAVAAALGLITGSIVAPALVGPTAGLLGTPSGAAPSWSDVATVVGTMVAVVMLAGVVPAWRAARTSTVQALADAGRRPRRSRLVIRFSARSPVPVLLGLRLVARRPRRALLTSCSIGVAVTGAVVALYARSSLRSESGPASAPANPATAQLGVVVLALTVLLGVMAAVVLVFVTRASASEARVTLALARALGASPVESASSLAVAQLVPALAGVGIGIGAGVGVFHVFALSDSATASPGALALVALGTLLVTLLLTAVPSVLESRRPIAEVLRTG